MSIQEIIGRAVSCLSGVFHCPKNNHGGGITGKNGTTDFHAISRSPHWVGWRWALGVLLLQAQFCIRHLVWLIMTFCSHKLYLIMVNICHIYTKCNVMWPYYPSLPYWLHIKTWHWNCTKYNAIQLCKLWSLLYWAISPITRKCLVL